MQAGAVPREALAGRSAIAPAMLLKLAPDVQLVALIREGREAAFEAAYVRHRQAILSLCIRMLGDPVEAEDAVQQTFLAAYRGLLRSRAPVQLRAWLFAVARNRCCSMLRERRQQPFAELRSTGPHLVASELGDPFSEALASQVQRRLELRELVRDLLALPPDQRAALVLAELEALSHEQIALRLGVATRKVKALVFQARESLLASRTARETDCAEIRRQLASLHGGALRRANLRRHLRQCSGCREFGMRRAPASRTGTV